MGLKYRNISSPSFNALDFEKYPPSIANLPAALTINGQTVYPTLRYKGRDATSALWRPWGYGETLTLQAGTAPSYNQGSPLLGASDDSVRSNAGAGYAFTNALVNVGNNDFVFETIAANYYPGITSIFFSTYAAPDISYFNWHITTAGLFSANTYGTTGVSILSAAIPWYTLYHLLFFYDKSGSAQYYINGQASGSSTSVSAIGSLNLTRAPAILARADAAGAGKIELNYFAFWHKASWLDTHLQATVAQTRFAQLTGVYPQSARGTYLPTAVTRSSAGYLDKIESDGTTKIYYMGANWPRVCSRKDSLGTARKGYLSETSASNLCLQSQTFATTWAAVNASVPTTSVVCPDGIARTTCTLHEDATAAQDHYLRFSNVVTSPSAGAKYVFSIWAKAVNRSWFYVNVYENTSPYTHGANFNLSSGAVGTTSGATATIENHGNGWYRCSVAMTVTAGATFLNLYLYAGEADNDVTFNGANQDSFYIFGAQLETGNYPSSYIPTTTAAVTRSADLLRYKMDDGNMSTVRGSLECNVLLPNIDNAGSPTPWSLSDGTANNRIVALAASAGNDFSTLAITTATVAQAAVAQSTDIWNNGWNKLRGIWGPNDARLLVNSVSEGTPDSSVTVPTGLTQLDVGAYLSAGYELGGLLANLKIYGLNRLIR